MNLIQEPFKKIRPASTVLLVRKFEKGSQVYLLRRSLKSGFFPGNYVFPGGAVDPEDGQVERWRDQLDLSSDELKNRFGPGLDRESLIAFGMAAIRETFEEARISLTFSDLFPWSHWITPQGMPKRFDTRFFLARLPEGQECIPDEKETIHGLWVSPVEGLQRNMQGTIALSPPTLITLHELTTLETWEDLNRAILSRSWGEPCLPMLMKAGAEAVLLEPWDPQYGQELELDPRGLKGKILPPGEPFSRLWLNEGVWRPIGL